MEVQAKSFFEQYKLAEVIGQGSFGKVIKAEHRSEGECAVKFGDINDSTFEREREIFEHIKPFSRESEIPIPYFFGYGSILEFSWLSMELLGPSIQTIFKKLGAFTQTTILKMGIEMLSCIEYLHQFGVVHGDLKGENFAIAATNPQKIKIFDFGLASKIDDTSATFHGSLMYASIATHKFEPVHPKDDIESLGYLLADYHNPLPWKYTNWPADFKDSIKYGLRMKKEKNIFDMSKGFFEFFLFLTHVDAKNNPSITFLKEVFRFVLHFYVLQLNKNYKNSFFASIFSEKLSELNTNPLFDWE